MEITIANIKQGIPSRDLRKMKFLAKSLTSNKNSIKTTLFESPKKGVRELRFESNKDNNYIAKLLIIYLSLLQDLQVPKYCGKWYTIKSGNYIVSIVEEGLSREIEFNGSSI